MKVRAYHLVDESSGQILAVKESHGGARRAADRLVSREREITIWGCDRKIRPGLSILSHEHRFCIAIVRAGRRNAKGYAYH